MPIIILMMHRKVIMQGLVNKFQDDQDIHLIHKAHYYDKNILIGTRDAEVVLIEAAESGYYNTAYCLALCQQIRKFNPECKLLVMCPEQNEAIKQVVDAKGKGFIDDFVFYDASIDYLASKLTSI